MWAQMSDDELLQRSDLVVLGEWVGQSEIVVAGNRLELGAVAIAEVLKGTKGLNLAYVRAVRTAGLRASDDIVYAPGQRGLWLLRLMPGANTGIYLADHPQRFVPADRQPARIEALRQMIGRR